MGRKIVGSSVELTWIIAFRGWCCANDGHAF